MKTGRWVTASGSVVLLLLGVGHSLRVVDVQKMIVADGMKPPLDGILKGCWMAFGAEMVMLAVIAMVASRLAKGSSIVLLSAATMMLNATLLFHFVGPFFGVYVSLVVGLIFLAGGWLQTRQRTGSAMS